MGYILDSLKALFTKNTTNAASVSGARVPIMSADGTPIGNDSLANLASVLGGVVTSIETGEDLNNYTNVGLYNIATGAIASSIVNFPDSANRIAGVLIVMPAHAQNSHRYQIYIACSSFRCEVYCRIKNVNGTAADSNWWHLNFSA